MATVRHIDKEAYAGKALELLSHRREGYIDYALGLMKGNMSPGAAGELVEGRVSSEMEDALFDYLKRSGKVSGAYRHQYYHVTGCYRTVRLEPRKSDVPSELLDIKTVLPNYEQVMGDIMVEAEKRWITAEIEKITREANEKQDDAQV